MAPAAPIHMAGSIPDMRATWSAKVAVSAETQASAGRTDGQTARQTDINANNFLCQAALLHLAHAVPNGRTAGRGMGGQTYVQLALGGRQRDGRIDRRTACSGC
jgi:hypothetical protein